ncbi:hypothetical protein FACS18945_5400 [Bacteroidia bacterium]|nr:hypothetical protein FACS18945_5400 [Bacteroidia bacterium]
MKKYILILLILSCVSCEKYSHTKMYEYRVKNNFATQTVKIIPTSASDFWVISNEEFIVVSGEEIIIGSKITYNDDKKAKDIYSSEDIIIPFELYVDDVKQEIDFAKRKFWTFSQGTVNESGRYTLMIDEKSLK